MLGRCPVHAFRWVLAAGLWLATGPLAAPLTALVTCHYHSHAMAGMPASHHEPASGMPASCFCDRMAAGFDALGTSPVVPATPAPLPAVATLTIPARPVNAGLPPSPHYPPEPPPPNDRA